MNSKRPQITKEIIIGRNHSDGRQLKKKKKITRRTICVTSRRCSGTTPGRTTAKSHERQTANVWINTQFITVEKNQFLPINTVEHQHQNATLDLQVLYAKYKPLECLYVQQRSALHIRSSRVCQCPIGLTTDV